MATPLLDSPPAPAEGQAPAADGSASTPPGTPSGGIAPPATVGRACANCGAEMAAGQEWCLQCGAAASGSLGATRWRSAAIALGAVAVLVLGAAAAAVAALSEGSSGPHMVTATVAQTPAPTTTAPGTPATPGGTTSTPGGTTTPKTTLPLTAAKPPKIPLTAVTPKASEKAVTSPPVENKASASPTTTNPSSTTGTGTGGGAATTNEESQQSAILLDTNAATVYNPYEYPASWFGDPSLSIDGDTSTAWTAQVNPATAPKMAEGLLIDLKAKQRVSVLQLVTSTPGMTVQVYGTSGHTAPSSITDPQWVTLSHSTVAKKKRLRLKLRHAKKAYTYITLWISGAPASAVGTATAPGHVDVNEVELFPPR